MKKEIHEMYEHAHAAQHDRSLLPITISMSILAVMVAVTSLFGHRSHTEELLLQNKVTDNWAFYQAKNIRKHSTEQSKWRVFWITGMLFVLIGIILAAGSLFIHKNAVLFLILPL